jgi:type VI secretion system protein VasG
MRTGFTILALLSDEELSRVVRDVSKELQKIQADSLKKDFESIVANSAETEEMAVEEAAAPQGGEQRPKAGGKTPNLDQYTVNLTENARQGKVDPVLARDFEIRQVIDILTRRRQNNPILVGEAGVGKTAVVEGFALRIAQGDVPPVLKNVAVRTLDLALLQAGAGVKGEFENRLKGLINEVKASPTPIILFIDEAHTMIGAGGQAGQNDAANLLKPALARGELRTVAATTWSEYKKYFEKDPALARRFQLVKVEEPTETQCALMLRGVVPTLEKHHKVRILDEGLLAGVKLSHRYLPDRQLPDKAVSVLDTACARLALGQNSTPPAIEDSIRTLDDLAVQTRILEREAAAGADHAERLATIAEKKAKTEAYLNELTGRWEKERDLVTRIGRFARNWKPAARLRNGRGRCSAGRRRHSGAAVAVATGAAVGAAVAPAPPAPDPVQLRAELAALNAELAAMQGETPLMRVCVDAQIIGEVVSAWTGIPVGKMLKDESPRCSRSSSTSARASSARIMPWPDQPAHPHRARRPGRSGQAGGRVPAGRPQRRRQDRDRAGAFRPAVRRRAKRDHHQYVGVPGSAYRLHSQGIASRIRRLWRRRRAHRSGPPAAVFGGAAGRSREGPPGCAGAVLPGVRQGQMEDGEGREIDFKNTIIILTSNAAPTPS